MPDTTTSPSLILRVATALMWCLNIAVTSLNSLGTILIMVMMGLICADVAGRNLLGSSLPGVIELTELGIVSIVFLQIADTYKSGKLMRSDGFIKAIEAKVPRVGLAVNSVFDTTGALLFFYIAKGAENRFSEAWEGGYYLGNQGSFTAPTWPMELIVALGSALLCMLFLASVLRNLSWLFGVIPLTENNGSTSDL
jgi:TRAP-type C4-dicarboxylate transport system permease small subunit